jgi:hypothetical protein
MRRFRFAPRPPMLTGQLRNRRRRNRAGRLLAYLSREWSSVHEISQQARQQVEAVCANSSLSIPQKRQQIKQIHQQERQQIDGIISSAQQEAIRSCQAERNADHSGGGHFGAGGGPCGEMPHKPNPEPDDETPPSDTAKPN